MCGGEEIVLCSTATGQLRRPALTLLLEVQRTIVHSHMPSLPDHFWYIAQQGSCPSTTTTAAWGFNIPYWCSAKGWTQNLELFAWLAQYQGSQVCWPVALLSAFFGAVLAGTCDQKKASQTMSFTRSTSSLLYLYLCLSHSGKVLNELAWHHSTFGIVVKRCDPENMQLCVWFYSHE